MIFQFLVALLATFSLTQAGNDEIGTIRFFTRGESHLDASFDMPLAAPIAKPIKAISSTARGVDNFNPHFQWNPEKRRHPGQWIFDPNYGWRYHQLFVPSNRGNVNVYNRNNERHRSNDYEEFFTDKEPFIPQESPATATPQSEVTTNVDNRNNGRHRSNDYEEFFSDKEPFIPQESPATATPQSEITATPQIEVPATETPRPERLLPATSRQLYELLVTSAPQPKVPATPQPEFLAIPQPVVLATAHAVSPATNQPVVPVTPQATPQPFRRITNFHFVRRKIRPFLPGDSHSKTDRLRTQATTTTKRPRSFFEPSSSEIDEFFKED